MARTKLSSRKALDLWTAPAGAGEPSVCLATTFTFDATFFERDCLGRFLAMEFDTAESDSVAYLVEREEKLAATRVCVLADRRHARDKQSMRWDVVPVMVPGAVQHAKLTLLAWARHLRVIVGSGNLTPNGYGRTPGTDRANVEVFSTLDWSLDGGGSRESVTACFEFLDSVLDLAVGDQSRGPIARAREALAAVRRHVRRWPEAPESIRCVPVFGGPKRSVIRELRDRWPSNQPPRTAEIASPFFDSAPNDALAPAAVVGVLAQRGQRDVRYAVRSEPLPDGRRRIHAGLGLLSDSNNVTVTVEPIEAVQEGEVRPYHAKVVKLSNDQWQTVMIGSSNCTAAGLGTRGSGNLEANLVYSARVGTPEGRRLSSLWPQTAEALDTESQELVWEPDGDVEGAGVEPCLPAAFVEAVFSAGTVPELRVTLGRNLPSAWKIAAPPADLVLASPDGEGVHAVPWSGRATPFVLQVWWVGTDGREWSTSWAVNVSDPASLPPPEELKALTLDDLLEVLASTRPIADAIAHILGDRRHREHKGPILDPLKRVDTHAFLLQRTKRVAAALDRLRERLERPVLTREALDWRLHGPVGPLALAQAFRREHTAVEARFFIAETALAVRRVRPAVPASGGLRQDTIKAALDAVVASLAADLEHVGSGAERTDSGVDAYVAAAMREAGV